MPLRPAAAPAGGNRRYFQVKIARIRRFPAGFLKYFPEKFLRIVFLSYFCNP